MTFDLDTPPSVNHMFANAPGIGRVKSAAYISWQRGQLKFLMAQRVRPVVGPVAVSILLPDTIRGDADNRCKPILDLLVKAQIIPDDNKRIVRSVSIGFHDGKLTKVEIRELA